MGAISPTIVHQGLLNQSSAAVIDGSLKFDRVSSTENAGYFKRTFAAGNSKKWTWSAWVKRDSIGDTNRLFGGNDGTASNTKYFTIMFASPDYLRFGGYTAFFRTSNALYRDTGWYHIVVNVDIDNATSANKYKAYINGEEVTWSSTGDETDTGLNRAGFQGYLGTELYGGTPGNGFGGRMTQCYFIDGQALEASDFGYTDQLTNTWRPKKFSGEFTTGGDALYKVLYSTGIAGTLATTAAAAFDGIMGGSDSDGAYPAPGQTLTWTPANSALGTTLPYSSTARVYVKVDPNGDDGGLTVVGANGSQTISAGSAGQRYVDISAATSPITSIAWSRAGSGSQGVGLQAVEIDGTILKDFQGKNSFYLPMDGNHPIGVDQSGRGNDWTPVNFGGSTIIDKATGALPILNTLNGGTIAGVGVRTDPYYANLVLALPLVGGNGDVSNWINNGSTAKVMTNVGDAAISYDTSNFYGGSYEFDGTGDGISTPDNTAFEFGSGDFTVECWVKQDTTSGFEQFVGKYGGSTDGEFIVGKNATTPVFYWQDSSGNANLSAANFRANTEDWYHIACVRHGDEFTIYINGIVEATTTDATTIKTTSNNLTIGIEHDGSSSAFDGYLQDVRIYKGVAKYTGKTMGTQYFVPPSIDPDILPETPSGVSYGSQLAKVPDTDGAVYFDGTGDSITTDIGSGGLQSDFCIEYWIYPDQVSSDRGHFQMSATSGGLDTSTTSLMVSWGQTEGDTNMYVGSANVTDIDDPNQSNVWKHYAVVRNSGTLKLYVNGKVALSEANTVDMTSFRYLSISGYYSTSFLWKGYISNFRVVSGSSVYTSEFTPPTAPLTNITNTKFLGCQSPTSAGEAAVGSSVTPWLPSGFTYWTAGMGSNWSQSGSTTSASGDYINVALPTSGKYYWESTLNTPSEFRQIGIQQGADFVAGYDNNYFGFYFNGDVGDPDAVFLTKNESGTDRGDAISNGATAGAAFSNGEKVMWAWDADNDKVWLGRDGTWYASGDPATGANASISGEDLSANSWYFKIGYNNETGATNTLTLTNVASGDAGSTTYPTVNGDTVAVNFNPLTDNIDTVMGKPTGYCTWDPLSTPTNTNYSDGNLTLNKTGTSHSNSYGTMGMKTGKWYWEITKLTSTGDGGLGMGLVRDTQLFDRASTSGTDRYLIYLQTNIIYYYDGNTTENNFSSTAAFNDNPGTFMFAFDADNQKLYFGKDGSWTNGTSGISGGNPSIGSGPLLDGFKAGETYLPWCTPYTSGQNMKANFGQKPFRFSPPKGFQPLNFANLPTPEVVRPDTVVGLTTYTGLGDGAVNAKNVLFDFDPDLCWLKMRSGTGENYLWDTVRGFGNNGLVTNRDHAEGYQSAYYTISKLNKGFNIIQDNPGNEVNYAGNTYVSWAWKAGGNKNTFNIDDVGYANASDVSMDAGDLNNYNQSATWSDNVSVSSGGYSSGQGPTQAFNGVAAGGVNMCQRNAAGGTITWTFSGLSGSCRVWIGNAGGTVTDGNGTVRGNNVGNGETWISLSGDISAYGGSIVISVSSDAPSLGAVEVAGKMLVDDDQTPPNVPSIAATGASVGTKQGFSITKHTASSTSGAQMTLAHGLTQKPDFIIGKDLDNNSTYWGVYHSSLGATKKLDFDQPAAAATNANYWSNTEPTSSVVYTNSASWMYPSASFMMYSWHNVPGLQKFGLYSGIASADGPVLDLGFRPAIIIFKNITQASTEWVILDNKRDGYNGGNQILFPSTADGENATQYGDFISSGFKFRIDSGYVNGAGADFIYAAWAYQPTNNLYGGQSNAR